MDSPSSPSPKHEPGGDRLMIVVALIVVTGLGGMTWSFFSRQSVPRRVPVVVPKPPQPAAAQSPTQPLRSVPAAPAPTPQTRR